MQRSTNSFTVPHRTNLEYELCPEWLGGQSSRKVISVSSLYNMTSSSQCGHRITLYSKQNQMQSVYKLLCNPVTTMNVGNVGFCFRIFNLIMRPCYAYGLIRFMHKNNLFRGKEGNVLGLKSVLVTTNTTKVSLKMSIGFSGLQI